MSNFGQGFQNASFDPSLLYGNASGVTGVGGVGGVGDASQQQGFNLNNAAGLGTGVGAGAAGGSIPANWLNSFSHLQSQASHQLNRQVEQPQQPGAGAAPNQLNANMLMGGGAAGMNDSQRQIEMVSALHVTNN